MAKIALGPAVNDIAGRYGNQVVARSRSGLVMKNRPRYRRPTSAAQAKAAQRMTQVSKSWAAISNAQAQAWNDYAATLTRHNPLTGQSYAPAGFNVYFALAAKVLQIDPQAEIPPLPPTADFLGDPITLEATPAEFEPKSEHCSCPQCGGTGLRTTSDERRNDAAERYLADRLSKGLGGGILRLTASGPNSEGVLTEILLQKMVNIRRSIGKDFKTTAFVAFTTGNPTHDLIVQSGAYAIAYRFVDPATGQSTLPLLVGKVEVG